MACSEKSFLMVVNALYMILSTCTTFIGIWILNDDKALEKLNLGSLSEDRDYYGISSVVFGILSIIVSFVGFWGAYKGVRVLLKVYAGILIVNLIFSFFSSIFVLMTLDPKPIAQMEPAFTNSTQDPYVLAQMHNLQTKFECCGYKGPKDVYTSKGHPWSCCGTDEKVICTVPTHTEGCFTQMKRKLTNAVVSKILVTVVASVVQGFCVFAALRLAEKVAKNPTTSTVYMNFT